MPKIFGTLHIHNTHTHRQIDTHRHTWTPTLHFALIVSYMSKIKIVYLAHHITNICTHMYRDTCTQIHTSAYVQTYIDTCIFLYIHKCTCIHT